VSQHSADETLTNCQKKCPESLSFGQQKSINNTRPQITKVAAEKQLTKLDLWTAGAWLGNLFAI